MAQRTRPSDQFEDAIELSEVIEALAALLEQGVKKLPAGLSRSFQRDDYATALSISRDYYSELMAGGRGSLREASIIYAVLLTYRNLTEEAAGVLRKSLMEHAEDVPLQLAQVLNLIRRSEVDTATSLLGLLRESTFKASRQWALMGSIYLDLDAIDDAIACYKTSLDLGNKDIEVAYRLSRLLWEHDDYRFDGAHYLEQAARLAVQDVQLWSLAGQAWSELGEWSRSVEAFARVTRLDEDDEEGWLSYGEALRGAGELPAAARAFERAARLDPLDQIALLELAFTQQEQGFFEEALQNYRKVLKEHPAHVEALQGAALSSFEMGDLEEAIRYGKQVVEHAEEHAEAHFNLGVLFTEIGMRTDAIASLERAVSLDPDHGVYRMRMALAMVGPQTEEAIAMANEAMKIGCEWSELLALIQRLVYVGDVQNALGFMDRYSGVQDVDWALITPLMRYIIASIGKDEPTGDAAFQAFERATEALSDELPLEWDLEEIGRVAQRLDPAPSRVARGMIRDLSVG